MINKGVKVTVDYSNGCYNVTGLYRGKVYSINKPIRGIDRDANFKANYSSRLIKNRKSQILRDIRRHIIAEDANFTYSRRAIKDVDTVMYKALQDWDSMNSTHYAIDYLKTVLQSFNSNGENTAEFKEKCKEKRAENLKKAGIDITYNLGMLKTSKKINMFDKIKGMMIAKKQNKVLGVNVNNSFIMNTPIYLEDKNWFKESEDEVIEEFGNDKGENDLTEKISEELANIKTLPINKKKFPEKILSKEELDNIHPLEQYDEEFEEFVARMMQNSKKITEKNAFSDRMTARVLENIDFKDNAEEDNLVYNPDTGKIEEKEQVAAISEDEVTEPVIQTIKQEEIEEPVIQTIKQEEVEEPIIQTIKQEEVEEPIIQTIKQEEVEEPIIKQEEVEQTKEQIIARIIQIIEQDEPMVKPVTQTYKAGPNKKIKKELHERKNFYKAQMERNLKHKEEKAKIKEAQAIKIAEKEAKEKEAKVLANMKKMAKENEKKLKEIEKARVAEEQAKKAIENEEAKKKVAFNLENNVSKKVKSGVSYLTRKINDAKEAIENKEFKANPRFKRVAITGAVTLLAAGSLSLGLNGWGAPLSVSKPSVPEKQDITYTEKEDETAVKLDYAYIETEKVEENKQKPETQKVIETLESKETENEVEKEQEDKIPKETTSATIETEKIVEEQETSKKEEEVETQKEPEVNKNTQETSDNEETKNDAIKEKEEAERLEKIEKFKRYAAKRYMESIVIGETPNVGDILENQVYSEKPDGTGNTGYISKDLDYHVTLVNIITDTGWYVETTEGENLQEILDRYEKNGMKVRTWNFHIATSANNLGFITDSEYESCYKGAINSIIEANDINNNINNNLDNDLER